MTQQDAYPFRSSILWLSPGAQTWSGRSWTEAPWLPDLLGWRVRAGMMALDVEDISPVVELIAEPQGQRGTMYGCLHEMQ